MCTYNGAQFLQEQLDSIARQTLLPDELIVCDDGSSDSTLELLEEFARRSQVAVHIHRNQQRLGFAQNFARCIELCQCDVIVLTDQDDRWSATRLERTAAAFAEDGHLTFTFSDASLIDPAGRALGESIYDNIPIARADRSRMASGQQILPVVLRWGVVYGCTMAIRGPYRSAFLPLPEGWSHDEWISLVLSSLGPSKRMSPVTEYRQHAAQLASGRKWTPLRHLREMRKRGQQEYEAELRRYCSGLEFARQKSDLQEVLVPALMDKIVFLEARQRIRAGGREAIASLWRLLRAGSYERLSAGWASVVKDVSVMSLSAFSRPG
jgi:glycosyltransferase involved in cell wall biosynthesis